MGEDSVRAAATLLHEVETNKALIHDLQTGQLSGRVDGDGKIRLRICARCDGPMKAGAA